MRARQIDRAPERYHLELPGESFDGLDLAAAWALIECAHTRAAPGCLVRWCIQGTRQPAFVSHSTGKARWRAIAPLPADLGRYLDEFGLDAALRVLFAGA